MKGEPIGSPFLCSNGLTINSAKQKGKFISLTATNLPIQRHILVPMHV